MTYEFSWMLQETLHDGCDRAAAKVEITYPYQMPGQIEFPYMTTSRGWGGAAKRITFHAVQQHRYELWPLPPKEPGELAKYLFDLYWFEIETTRDPTTKQSKTIKGFLPAYDHDHNVKAEDAQVMGPEILLYKHDIDFLIELLAQAKAEAKAIYERDEVESKGNLFGWGRHEIERSPAQAFYKLMALCTEGARQTNARAYLVDWALAERRTGLKFQSMEAFEQWAASASEDEDEM